MRETSTRRTAGRFLEQCTTMARLPGHVGVGFNEGGQICIYFGSGSGSGESYVFILHPSTASAIGETLVTLGDELSAAELKLLGNDQSVN